ncbi:MAG: hypothetical protein JSR96_13630 [Proteobacteria bacterium]|nr:hypothetical protein [Pseudomonadota bacterium]
MLHCKYIVSLMITTGLIATPASAGETEAALIGAVIGNVLGSKTELAANAGEIESSMINSRLLLSAALTIAKDAKVNAASGLLLVGDEDINLGLADDLTTLMDWHLDQLKGCAKVTPKPKKQGGRGTGEAEIAALTGLGGALADAIKGASAPKTTITGYKLTVPESALVAAMQTQSPEKWVRVDDVAQIDSKTNPIAIKWTELRTQRTLADTNACAASDNGKARIKASDAFQKQITDLGEKGAPSLLLQAERIAALAEHTGQILRVRIEGAGGSVINADNLLTRLGMPAVSVTGATIVSYRLIDPKQGQTSAANLIVCYTPKRHLRDIHKGRLPSAEAKNCIGKADEQAGTSKSGST